MTQLHQAYVGLMSYVYVIGEKVSDIDISVYRDSERSEHNLCQQINENCTLHWPRDPLSVVRIAELTLVKHKIS
jgi:hypothetical protein